MMRNRTTKDWFRSWALKNSDKIVHTSDELRKAVDEATKGDVIFFDEMETLKRKEPKEDDYVIPESVVTIKQSNDFNPNEIKGIHDKGCVVKKGDAR